MSGADDPGLRIPQPQPGEKSYELDMSKVFPITIDIDQEGPNPTIPESHLRAAVEHFAATAAQATAELVRQNLYKLFYGSR